MRRRLRPPRRLIRRRTGAGHGETPATGRRQKILFWAAVLGGIGGLATVVVALRPVVVAATSSSTKHDGRLVMTEAYVRNDPEEETYADSASGLVQNLASSPTVDIVLHNESRERKLVKGVTVWITNYANLRICFTQGGGPLPEPPPHIVMLPAYPLPHEPAIQFHFHDEIPPGEYDSIPVRFAARKAFIEYGVYRLRVDLDVDGGGPIDIGTFVLSTPTGIEGASTGQYLPVDEREIGTFVHGTFHAELGEVSWCWLKNLTELQSIVSWSGVRAADLASLGELHPTPGWNKIGRTMSGRKSAMALLHKQFTDPSLAAFAAHVSGDPALIKRVDRLVVEKLLDTGEEDLDGREPLAGGEQEVRKALLIEESSRGQRLLAQYRARSAAKGSAAP
jgi:hypothetical protein